MFVTGSDIQRGSLTVMFSTFSVLKAIHAESKPSLLSSFGLVDLSTQLDARMTFDKVM